MKPRIHSALGNPQRLLNPETSLRIATPLRVQELPFSTSTRPKWTLNPKVVVLVWECPKIGDPHVVSEIVGSLV